MAKRPHSYTARIELRCSSEELERWRRAATEHQMPLSRYVRICLNRGPALARTLKADPALIRQIAAIGNNLNQSVHWANAYKSAQEAGPVEEEVRRTRQALERLLDSGRQP